MPIPPGRPVPDSAARRAARVNAVLANAAAITEFDSFKIRDGRPIGDISWGELERIEGLNLREAFVIKQIRKHAVVHDHNTLVRNAITAGQLARIIQRGSGVGRCHSNKLNAGGEDQHDPAREGQAYAHPCRRLRNGWQGPSIVASDGQNTARPCHPSLDPNNVKRVTRTEDLTPKQATVAAARAARRRKANGKGQVNPAQASQAPTALPVRTLDDDIIEAIIQQHRVRRFAIKTQQKLDRSLESFIRRNFTDWAPDLPEKEKTMHNARVAQIIKRARQDEPPTKSPYWRASKFCPSTKPAACFDDQRLVAEKERERLCKMLPVAVWVDNVRGAGLSGLADIIGEAGRSSALLPLRQNSISGSGLHRTTALAGSTWKRATWRPRALTKEEWIANPFSGERYGIMRALAEPMLRANWRNPTRKKALDIPLATTATSTRTGARTRKSLMMTGQSVTHMLMRCDTCSKNIFGIYGKHGAGRHVPRKAPPQNRARHAPLKSRSGPGFARPGGPIPLRLLLLPRKHGGGPASDRAEAPIW